MANKRFFVDVDVQTNDVVNLKADTLDITSNLASANSKRIVYWSGQYYYSNGTSWLLINTGQSVTSVGLTMPSAFTVSNSPITTSGDIAVTGSGLPSQYVRGDGSLASFPDIAGGGGGQVFYFNGGTSQGTIGGDAFEQLSPAAVIGTGVDFTSGTVDDVTFANFITDVGKPTQETIPAGVWIFQVYLSATAANCEIYATVEVYNGTTFTVLSTSLNEVITNGSTIDLYTFTCAVPEYTPLVPADRIAIRFYPNNLAGTETITLHTQDAHTGSVQTTFTTGIASLDGLTSAAQYFQTGISGSDFNVTTSGTDTHIFNLPTASAVNRGALSASDWTTFNNKQGAITLTTTGTSGAATLVGNTLNVPQYSVGAVKEFVRLYHPLWTFAGTAVNTWFSWTRNATSMISSNTTSLGSTTTPPSLIDQNFILVDGKTKLNKVSWSIRDGGNSQNIEIYIRSFTFANGTGRGSETNVQLLVNQTWALPSSSSNGFKNNFTIASHTLDPITGIQIAVRITSGTPTSLQGVQLILEFE